MNREPSQADLNEIYNSALTTGLGYIEAREKTKQVAATEKAKTAQAKIAELASNKNVQIGAGLIAAILIAFLIFKKR